MTQFTACPRASLLVATASLALACAGVAAAETPAAPPAPGSNDIAEGSAIVVTGTKANEIAPVTASLQQKQPASIVSRSFIEDSLPASADFNQIALIAPSVSNNGATNGVGLNESKTQIRGFQDGEYNITYDGVPFGDTNDPSHHSNTFFPSNTIETLIVDRGPGNASQLGIATFGGNINMFSREARDEFGAELKGTYGTFNTFLARGLLQSGEIPALGRAKGVLSAQYIRTDGALTYSKYNQKNIFGKLIVPIGNDVTLSFLSTYNRNRFNQPDSDGSTLAQVTLYGKDYSLNNDPTSQSYYNYNVTTKTTDFEIVKLVANINSKSTFTNSAYTYYYDNETLSGNSATTLQGTANTVTLADGKTKVSGVPGYTKTNKYRVWGDIAKVKLDFGFGALTVGAWLEHNDTFRQQTDVNLSTGGFNYVEKAVADPVSKVATPLYVKFNQNSYGNHTEEFGELELRPLPGLTITPGIKHVDFQRGLNALYNQTTRVPQQVQFDAEKTLPFAQINYAVTPWLAVYGEFAKGFLAPGLSVLYIIRPDLSTVQPQTSTNYQAGFVYHGSRLSLDFDGYYIDFNNKINSETIIDSTGASQAAFYNQGGVIYKGLEGQATYVVGHGVAVFGNASLNYAKEKQTEIQVANAPKGTIAGGALYKHGPIRFSIIDKWTGPQYAVRETFSQATGLNTLNRQVRIKPYNTTILAASYEWRNIRIGVEVTDLFNSTQITKISTSGAGVAGQPNGIDPNNDQLYFQPGRQITGDITVRF
jgi:iron complex outermembrane receptor protein